jgi:PAS domain S-box-containing protein
LSKEKDMPISHQLKFGRLLSPRLISVFIVIFLIILAGGLLGSHSLIQHGKNEIAEEAEDSIHILAADVDRMMEDVDKVSKILSTSPGVIAGLTSGDVIALEAVNKVLDRYAQGIQESICYVLNLQGDTVASSNRNETNSFVGHNYQFRSYFKEALQAGWGRCFALGVTSETRGYYSSHVVQSPETGEAIGVVVVKKEAESLRESFRKTSLSFLVDQRGVVFFASSPSFVFHLTRSLSSQVLEELIQSKEFGPGPFLALNIDFSKNKKEITFNKKKFFILQAPIALKGWTVVYLGSMNKIKFYTLFSVIMTLLVCGLFLAATFIFYINKKANQNNQLLASVAESSDDAIIVKALDGTIIEWNDGAEKIYGYKRQEAIGQNISMLIPPENSRERIDIFARARKGQAVNHFETIRLKKDGTRIYVSLTVSPIKDPFGRIVGAASIARDITAHKEAEKVLDETRKALEEKALGLEKTNEAIKVLYKEIAEKTVRLEASQKEILKGKDIAERIYKVIPSALFTVDKNRRITSWNNKAAEITGYSEAEVLGKECLVFCETPCKRGCNLYNENKEKPILAAQATIRTKEGMIRVISKNVDILKDDHGNIVGGIESFEDITERIVGEESLRESEEKYRHLVENANSIILRLDAQGHVAFFNEYAEKFFGFAKEEILGKHVLGTIVPTKGSSGQELGSLIQKIIENPQEHEINENENICKDGKRVWIRWSNKVIINEKTKEKEVLCVGSDITRVKKAQEQLFRLSRAVEQSPATVVVTDTKGNIEYVNPKFCQITGYTVQEALGQNPRVLKSGEQSNEFYKNLWDTILRGEEWRGQFSNKKKNGEIFYEDASISAVKDEQGNIINFIAVKEDVTEKRATEEKAKEAMRIKSDFISVVSHELRTPLTAIKEGISIVADGVTGEVNKDQQEFLDVAKRNVDRLSRLINDVLDFQKLDMQHMSFELSAQNINDVVAEVASTMSKVAEKENVQLSVEPALDLPALQIDKDRIIQVLTNLVNNALKYAPGNPVVIKTSKQVNTVTVSVIDHGEGIKEEDTDKLFQTFSQLKKGKERKTGSTGLGLAISKKIIEQHNGKIWVESAPGKGCTFSFLLPIAERRKRA